MANGDLIAKLRLDSKEFDTNINRSRRQVNDFQRNTESFAGAGVKAFGAFAGGVLAGAATLETFNKFMNSTQTSADALEFNINAAANTVTAFFSALNLGDWSAFNKGIIDTFRNLKELEAVWAEIDDKRLTLGYVSADDARNMAKYREGAMDSSNSYETRKNNLDSYRTVVLHQNNENKRFIEENLKAINQDNKIKLGYDITINDLDEFWRYTNASEELKEKYAAIYAEFISKRKEVNRLEKEFNYEVKRTGYNPDSKIQKEYSIKSQELKLFEKQNLFAIKQARLDEEDSVSREKKLKLIQETLNLEEANYNRLQDVNKLQKRIGNGNESGLSNSNKPTNKPVAPPPPSGSIANDKKMLGELRKQFENATDEGIRKTLRNQIYFLDLELRYKETGKQEDTIEMLQIDDVTTEDLGLKFVEPQKLLDTNKDDLDYLNTMSNLMTSIASSTGMASDNFLSYTANVLSGVGQLLPQLFQVFAIKSKIAIADSAALPPPLNIIAMGATAAALASTIAGLPKFENGGIVGGNSFSGDKILARLNTGEAVFTKNHQNRLFNMLNSGSVGGSAAGTGEVQFKVQGKDLIGVLNNYNNKFSRI